ncbi:stalk domain-containing protein [Paenisporosarcina indica]|uniref:stalk domain-containing protein n=1 Tax=Paenisporosarcina indica TaxID=650093 RepID=UPI000A80E681|nr:stalk domain-containing protein [Paenisporosarcina indica]
MKRKITSLALATAVFLGSAFTPIAINNVSAATTQQQQISQKDIVIVNGQEKVITITLLNKKKLYSVDQLSQIMAATVKYNSKTKSYEVSKKSGNQVKKIVYKVNSASGVVNGKKVKLSTPTKMIGKTLFVEIDSLVKTLGGDLLVDKNLLITVNGTINLSEKLLIVDGNDKKVKTLSINGKQLYSVQDIAKLYSASTTVNKNNEVLVTKKGKTIKLKLSNKNMVVNNKSVMLKENPIIVKNVVFADLSDLVKAFDGDILPLTNGYFISTTGLVDGDTFNPQWVGNDSVLVMNETETESRSLLLNTSSKKAQFTVNATELKVSPNGKQAIYSDENGYVYLVDLVAKKVNGINLNDDSVKLEFIWSKDSQKVYFLQGDKSEIVSSINVIDGSITKIFEDKLIYKTDLRLSIDGNKLLYVVGKEGTTSLTKGEIPEVDSIDLTDTEQQIYVINLKDAESKAVSVTTTKDNKVFPGFLENGDIVYISADTETDKLPDVKVINTENVVSTLIPNIDIKNLLITSEGKLMILTRESNGYSVIYKWDTVTKKLNKIAQTKLELTSFSVSNDGKTIVATTSGKDGEILVLLKNGKIETLTK